MTTTTLDTLHIRRLIRRWKVVAADDDLCCLHFVQHTLGFYGAEVYEAPNGAVALDLARQVAPLFVITDLSMPVMSGWELLEALRADRRLSRLPVVALTAHAMRGDRERVLQAGFDVYVPKPFRPYELVVDLVARFSHLKPPSQPPMRRA